MPKFGEYPLRVYTDAEGYYHVSQEDQGNADECGVTAAFGAERLEIMRNRALAYGYQLQLIDPPVSDATVLMQAIKKQ